MSFTMLGGLRFVGTQHLRCFSTTSRSLIEVSDHGSTRVLKMNNGGKLNAWTEPMLNQIKAETDAAKNSADVKAVVLTGSGRYYSSGVDLRSVLRPMMPSTLFGLIKKKNQDLFDLFIEFPKPLVIGLNGHAVGAAATSTLLTDAIVALDNTTISTPFHALGLCPEGCSSVTFEQRMNKEMADSMLGPEAAKPDAKKLHEFGVIEAIVTGEPVAGLDAELAAAAQTRNEEALVAKAIEVAESYVAKGKRLSPAEMEELKKVNAKESVDLATCFFSVPFLKAQREFAKDKGKKDAVRMFDILLMTRPIWSLTL